MNRKAYTASVLLFAALGLVLSVLIFPSGNEEALMYFFDKRYSEAYQKYSKLYYEEKDHSVSVSIPLTWLYLHFAEEEKAIHVLEDFIAKNPGNIDAKEYLGELYRNANRPYEYLMNLDEIYRLNPSGEILRKQERIYTQIGDLKGKTAALERLYERGDATQEEYRDLAYVYFLTGEEESAVDVVDTLLAQYPISKLEPQTLSFALSLYLDVKQSSNAKKLAESYALAVPNVDSTLLMINIFKERNMFEEGLLLLNSLPMKDQQLPAVTLARASLLIGADDKGLAYDYLKTMYDKGKLPKKMQGTFLSLALFYEKEQETLLDIIAGVELWRVPQDELLQLANIIIRRKMVEAADIAQEHLGIAYLAAHPILSIALEMGSTPPSEEEIKALEELHAHEHFSDREKVLLGEIYFNKGYTELAKTIFEGVDSFENVKKYGFYDLASMYVVLGLADKAMALIDTLDKESLKGESNIEEAWVLLSAATGKDENVKKYLQENKDIEDTYIADLFYAAQKRGDNAFALYLAKYLSERNPTPNNSALLANALVEDGQIEAGMLLLQSLVDQGYDASESYIPTLAKASKKNDIYRETLRKAILHRLDDTTLSDERKREYGFYLLDNAFKEEAAEVFMPLAEGQPFHNDDVQNLLASWDEKISDEQALWVAEQAEESVGKEKGDWLSYLSYSGHPSAVIGLVNDEDLNEESVADAYIDAAGVLEDKAIIADAVTKIYPREQRLPRLKELGSLTFGYSLYHLSKEIYQRILDASPSDKDALKAMGIIAFNEGRISCARIFFEQYLCRYVGDYQLYFFYGEVLWEEKIRDVAKDSFKVALNQARTVLAYETEDEESKKKEVLLTMVSLYHRLKRDSKAIGIYNGLLAHNPNDMRLRIDFANFMMDVDGYRSAASLLGCSNHCVRCNDDENDAIETDHALAWARYLKQTAKLKSAVGLIQNIENEHPDDDRVYAASADIHYSAGQWRRALCKINQALRLQPQNERYAEARKDIIWEHLPYFYTDFEYRRTGLEQKEHFYRVHCTTLIQEFTTMELRYDRDRVFLGNYTNLKGEVDTFQGTRQKGEVSVWHDCLNGRRFKGAFYFTESVLGGAFEWEKHCYNDLYTVALVWHEPSWEDIQLTIEYGTKDRFIVSRHHRFDRAWEASVTCSLNRYGLHNFPSAATSWELEGLVTFTFPRQQNLVRLFGDDTTITLNYFLDKEQIERLKKKLDPQGVKFAPLPLGSRESHNWYGFINTTFFEGFNVEAYFGYTWDRETKKSMLPIGGCSVLLLRREDVQLRFNYNHSASTEDTQQLVDSWLFSLRYVY